MAAKTISFVSVASGSARAQFHRADAGPQTSQVTGALCKGRQTCRQQKLAITSHSVPEEQKHEMKAVEVGRRVSLLGSTVAMSAILSPPVPALADESRYQDTVDKWSMAIPEDWELGVGEADGNSATRRVVAFFPKDSDAAVNVTVVCTNVAADFTKMGSFGTPYEFGTRLVGSLDRSYVGKKPKFLGGNGGGDGTGQRATLITTGSTKDMYNIEYRLEKPNEFDRLLYQVVGLSFNGMYNRLYTVTAQVPAERYSEDVKKVLTTMLGSFEMPKIRN